MQKQLIPIKIRQTQIVHEQEELLEFDGCAEFGIENGLFNVMVYLITADKTLPYAMLKEISNSEVMIDFLQNQTKLNLKLNEIISSTYYVEDMAVMLEVLLKEKSFRKDYIALSYSLISNGHILAENSLIIEVIANGN